VPVDHPTIDHRKRLWDRRSEIAADPFRILYQKNVALCGNCLVGRRVLFPALAMIVGRRPPRLEEGKAAMIVGRRPPRLEEGKAESKPEIEPALAARQNVELGRSRANAPARPGAELVATLTKNQEENHG
jgi:hypothetical protein